MFTSFRYFYLLALSSYIQISLLFVSSCAPIYAECLCLILRCLITFWISRTHPHHFIQWYITRKTACFAVISLSQMTSHACPRGVTYGDERSAAKQVGNHFYFCMLWKEWISPVPTSNPIVFAGSMLSALGKSTSAPNVGCATRVWVLSCTSNMLSKSIRS